jgi:Domain of unknown function (DUF3597)
MSIFGSIVSAIFGHSSAAGATPAGSPAAPATKTATSAPTPTGATTASPPLAPARPLTREEVTAQIKKLADAQSERLNWRESIVDLMKLLKLDSSLAARKQLAQELGYTGALNGSAEMNIWLHEQVMSKLAEGGGKVPESLKH